MTGNRHRHTPSVFREALTAMSNPHRVQVLQTTGTLFTIARAMLEKTRPKSSAATKYMSHEHEVARLPRKHRVSKGDPARRHDGIPDTRKTTTTKVVLHQLNRRPWCTSSSSSSSSPGGACPEGSRRSHPCRTGCGTWLTLWPLTARDHLRRLSSPLQTRACLSSPDVTAPRRLDGVLRLWYPADSLGFS